jgi:hypothetical protein
MERTKAEQYAIDQTKAWDKVIPEEKLTFYRLSLENAYMQGAIDKMQEQLDWFRNNGDDDDDDDNEDQLPVNPDPVKDFINSI